MHPVRSCTLLVAVARNLLSFNLIVAESEELRRAEKSRSTPTMPEALRNENSLLEDKSKTVSLGKVDGKKQSKLFCLSHLSAAHTPWYCWSPLLEHLPWSFTWYSAAQLGADTSTWLIIKALLSQTFISWLMSTRTLCPWEPWAADVWCRWPLNYILEE